MFYKKLPSDEMFLSARKADLKKGFQHLVVVLLVFLVVVCTQAKNAFRLLKGIQCEMLEWGLICCRFCLALCRPVQL
jgi:hypothetical protein